MEKEKHEKLIANFTKIQGDCRELSRQEKDNRTLIENLKKQAEKLSEDNSSLIQQNDNKDSKVNNFIEKTHFFIGEFFLFRLKNFKKLSTNSMITERPSLRN
jgi:hypothetical protein